MTTSPHSTKKFNRIMFIVTLALAGTCLLNMFTVENNDLFRQLDSTNTNAKQTISNPETMTIHFYIKTSGLDKYFKRAKRMVKTWGMDAAGSNEGSKLTLMTDGKNKDAVDKFGSQHSYIEIVHVEGTDRQGEYKGGGDKSEAWHAQRIKTRAVFTDFAGGVDAESKKGQKQQPADWLCYLDDDMMVNVNNLKIELGRMWHSCNPNCFVADGMIFWGHVEYTGGGYCMERDLASRIETILSEKTDEELKWDETDDLSFNMMLKRELNVTRINSDYWYSQLSRPKVTGTVVEKVSFMDEGFTDLVPPTWKENPVFMKNWVPTLSVFFQQYAPPVVEEASS